VKSSQTFDGQNLSPGEKIQGFLNGISRDFFPSPSSSVGGTTGWTGIGLRVEPPVRWVFILFLTDRAHYKRDHRRFMAIIRDIFDYGESWTTKGAINKRVTVSKVFRRKKFRKTLITGGHIRRDEDKFFLSLLPSDFKGGIAERFDWFYRMTNPGEWGKFGNLE
jgi:hypothetical protein